MGFFVIGTLGPPFVLTIPLAMMLGILATRHRVLEEPMRHRRLLVRVGATGIPLAWVLGAPGAP